MGNKNCHTDGSADYDEDDENDEEGEEKDDEDDDKTKSQYV